MASLISPGVSVTVTDESFFIAATAKTVPLFFIATEAEKLQPDGVTAASGTYESNVIRTVTSMQQSLQLYGTPKFLEDDLGQPKHGDCRNEYGLLALNQYLSVGDRAYVIRANIDSNDDLTHLRSIWSRKNQEAADLLEVAVESFLSDYNFTNNLVDPNLRTTVNQTELLSLIETVLSETVFNANYASFLTLHDPYYDDATATPLDVYAAGYDVAPTGTYIGLVGLAADWVANTSGSVVGEEWTSAEASAFLLSAAENFQYVLAFRNETSLGLNDTERRAKIVTALTAIINSNTDIRGEAFEYNLIACPGYWESTLTSALQNLNIDILDEAFIVGSTPFTNTQEQTTAWSATPSTIRGTDIVYYYPPCGETTNVDGKVVIGDSVGIAIKTLTYSDNESDVWFAPAGIRRGAVSGISRTGYLSGTLGTSTVIFNEAILNNGQRDDLYKYDTNINPITYFTGRGILVWGQKTAASAASALDRVAVSRLVAYLKRYLRKNLLPFVFEPNDQLTRNNIKTVVDSFLSNLITKRALYDFATVCDESNNTPTRIDNNELWIDVFIKPVKAAEFIYVPLRVVNTGTMIG